MTCHDDGLRARCGDCVHYVRWPEAALDRNVRPGADAAYRVTDGCCMLTGYRAAPVDSGDSPRSPLHLPRAVCVRARIALEMDRGHCPGAEASDGRRSPRCGGRQCGGRFG